MAGAWDRLSKTGNDIVGINQIDGFLVGCQHTVRVGFYEECGDKPDGVKRHTNTEFGDDFRVLVD